MKSKAKKSRDKDGDSRPLGRAAKKLSKQTDPSSPPLSPSLSSPKPALVEALPPLPPSIPSSPRVSTAIIQQSSPALSTASLISPLSEKAPASELPSEPSVEASPSAPDHVATLDGNQISAESAESTAQEEDKPSVTDTPDETTSSKPNEVPENIKPAETSEVIDADGPPATEPPQHLESPPTPAETASSKPNEVPENSTPAETPEAKDADTPPATEPSQHSKSSPTLAPENIAATAEAASETTIPTTDAETNKPLSESSSQTTIQDESKTDAIEEPKPPAPTPPPTTPRPLQPARAEPDQVLVSEPRPNPRPQFQSVSQAPLSLGLNSQHQYPPAFPRGFPAEHYSTPPIPGYHPRYISHTPPSAPPYYHNMAQPNGYPSGVPYSMQPQHGSPPYLPGFGGFNSPYGPYGGSPLQRHDSMASRGSIAGEFPLFPPGTDNSSAIEDDSGDLFTRISAAIPDLHLLLSKYRETHGQLGQLGMREEFIRRAEAQHADAMKRKDDHIDTLAKQLDVEQKKFSSEMSKLRLEIGDKEEKLSELGRSKKKDEEAMAALEAEKRALEREKADLEKSVVEAKERLLIEFEGWKAKANESLEAEKMALAVAFDKQLKEQELLAETEKTKATEEFVKQKDEMRSEFQNQKRQLETSFERVRREIETKLNSVQKDLEEALKKERESREVWSSERDDLVKAHEHDRETLQKGWEEQREILASQHKKAKEDSDKAWIDLHADTSKKVDEERAKAERLAKEKDDIQKCWDEEKQQLAQEKGELQKRLDEESAQFTQEKDRLQKSLDEERERFANEKEEIQKLFAEERAKLSKEKDEMQKRLDQEKTEHERNVEVIQSVAENLEAEKARLEKLVQCYGDVTDIKSKGDAYYLDSFSQLSKQIMDLSSTLFTHLPVTPPADILSLIPPRIPSFLGDTASSRQLRAAYVAHTISTILTFRVFTPFLFSLGRRFDKADGLFTAMSSQLREKSTRKEAVWRQHTLVAAFTSSDAKQRINSAAGSVVEEIVNAIKYFTDPNEEEALRVGVRRIVKLAAESWRFARLEREMIVAKMPAVDDTDEDGTSDGFWPAHGLESEPTPTDPAVAEFQERPRLLLRLFPAIVREAIHECFQITEQEKGDTGCIYSHGLALYDNATPVLVREEELRQAGLPPPTALSPSAADYPPPTLPPPRNPLPLVPQPPEEAVVASLTPPPPPTPISTPDNAGRDVDNEMNSGPGYPTPPRSRAGTPTSPLFAAVDEIEGLKQHTHRGPSLIRRSTGTVHIMSRGPSEDTGREESIHVARRASGYTISNKSSMDNASSKSGSGNSRYRSDSRSAAIKGLYSSAKVNSPVPTDKIGSINSMSNSITERSTSLGKGEDWSGQETAPSG